MIINEDIINWATKYNGQPFHAILCDPPYHLTSIVDRCGKENSAPATHRVYKQTVKGFMGKQWDGGDIAFKKETWELLSKHLLPGGFILAFASTRGFHRMAIAMEQAGLIMHPFICWNFANGFPKATRIKEYSDNNEWENNKYGGGNAKCSTCGKWLFSGNPCTCPKEQNKTTWSGHRYGGQALKPSVEPILVFQKPYVGRPIDNITQTGAGALNIDGTRIFCGTEHFRGHVNPKVTETVWKNNSGFNKEYEATDSPLGRWTPNLILQHCPECKKIGTNIIGYGEYKEGCGKGGIWASSFGEQAGPTYGKEIVEEWDCVDGCAIKALNDQTGILKSGERKSDYDIASEVGSRFYYNADYVLDNLENIDPLIYCPKASTTERNLGLDTFPKQSIREQEGDMSNWDLSPEKVRARMVTAPQANIHPTVKPISLTKYLATLLLPPKEYAGRILIPFAGAGSEMIGAMLAGWSEVIGIELEKQYCDIAQARIEFWKSPPKINCEEVELKLKGNSKTTKTIFDFVEQ